MMENLPETELLQYIYKTADMGCEGIDAVEKHAEKKLLQELLRERSQYENIRTDAENMIRQGGEEPSGSGVMAKMSADVMTAGQLMMDDSRSKIAEMMIQGTTMGIVKTIRHLKDYEGDDEEARGLGERLLRVQEENVEKMKAYL